MTDAFSWVRTSRTLLGVVVGFIVISVLYTLRNDGFTVATDLSDMVPSAPASEAYRLAAEAAQSAAGKSVILALKSSDQAALYEAVAILDTELASMSAWFHRQSVTELAEQVVKDLAPYRFHLLTNEDGAALGAGDFDSILERALGDLYSPSGGLNLLPISQDPFNFFSRYVESGIGRAGSVSGIESSQDTDVKGASDPFFYEIFTLRLKTDPDALPDSVFKQLDRALLASYPAVKTLRTGVLFFSREAASVAKRDINFISVGSVVGVSFLMLMVFSSLRPLITATVSILLGISFAFTVVHMTFGHIHIFTVLFGASLIGIVIDYSIHYCYHSVAGQSASDNTSPRSKKRLYRALLISLMTSVAGFGALLFSSVVMLKTIAIFSICGIIAAWLTVLAMASDNKAESMKVRRHLVSPIASGLASTAGGLIVRLDRRLIVFALALVLAGVVAFSKGQDDPRAFIDLSKDLLQQSVDIRTLVNDLEPGKFFIVEASDEQALFDRLGELYAKVGNQARLISVFDWLPSPADQLRNYQALAPVFEQSGIVDEFFAATGGSNAWLEALRKDYQLAVSEPLTSVRFFQFLDEQISPMVLVTNDADRQKVSLAAFVLLGSGTDLEMVKMLGAEVEGVSYVDTVASSSAQLRDQRRSSIWLLILAYAAVGLLMYVLYRDRRALLMLAVPVVSTVSTLGVLLVIGQPLTLFHTMSLFLILGLGMDYVVFLNEMTHDQEVTQQAILLSGLTSMLSFGLLAASSVPVAQAFGMTILLGNSFNLLITLGLSRSVIWHQPARK
ncbi:MAG: MMPL family transporter [Granulosicoccus sp.]